MSDIHIIFKNYKLLKEGEINLKEGSIFFVQGQNNKGKTSMLNLLRSIMEVKDSTVNPVSFGQEEGFATGVIPGADGNLYHFRYDFNVEGKSKFTFIDFEGKVIKGITQMRSIFNYTHFTVEEFFDWSKSEPGRKKQRDILMNLLSEDERSRITEIDLKVNPTNGSIVESRKLVGVDVDFLKKKIDNNIITDEQLNLLKSKNKIEDLYITIKKEKEDLELILSKSGTNLERIEELKEDNEKAKAKDIEKRQLFVYEISELEKKLNEKKEAFALYKKQVESELKESQEKIDNLTKDTDVEYLNQVKLKLNGDGTEKNPGLNKRLEIGQQKKDEIIKIEVLNNQKVADKTEYDKKLKTFNDYDKEIKDLRDEKKSIIQNSPSIPDGWEINSDYITINNIPFVESDISKSQATKAIAELMMRVNQSPIMLMGDAESLGYEVLDQLDAAAKDNGKIMIFAEHIREIEERRLICYDDMEHGSKEPEKTLF